jgi:hypothetical protein
MQLRRKKLWRSTKKVTDMPSSNPKEQLKSESPSYSIFQKITELPLSRWIDLTVDGYTKAIIKEGDPPQIELIKAENNLRIQYADAIGDHEYRLYCSIAKEITEQQIILTQIQNLVDTLRGVYQPVLAKELNRIMRTSFVFDVHNGVEYDKTLDRIINRSKGIRINMDLQTIRLKKLEEKYQSGGKPTREYYIGILLTLSDAAKRDLSDSMTVWEFCERIKRHNKANEIKPLKRTAK